MFLIKEILRKKSGFSLAEITIAAGMIGIISLGVLKLTQTMNQGQKVLAQDFEINQIMYALTMGLRDPDVCKATFAGKKPGDDLSSLSVGPYNLEVGQEISTQGSNAGYKIRIEKIQLGLFRDEDGNPVTPDSKNVSQTTIAVKFTRMSMAVRKRENTGSSEEGGGLAPLDKDQIEKKFAISVRVDENNTILDCSASNDAYAEAMCQSLGGTFDPINIVCSNIKIQDVTAVATPAITGVGNLSVENSLFVGIDPTPTAAPGEITALGVIQSYGNIQTTEGNIEIKDNGQIITNGGDFDEEEGNIYTKSGNITAQSGIITSGESILTDIGSSGSIYTEDKGNIYTKLGSISSTSGEITAAESLETDLGEMKTNDGNNIISEGSFLADSIAASKEMQLGGDTVATEEWVENALKGTAGVTPYSTSDKDDMVGFLLADTNAAKYDALVEDISDYARENTKLEKKCGNLSYIQKISGTGELASIFCSTPLEIPEPETDTRCDRAGNCNKICIGGECRDSLWDNYAITCSEVEYTGGWHTPKTADEAGGTFSSKMDKTFGCGTNQVLSGWYTHITHPGVSSSGSTIRYEGYPTRLICCTFSASSS